MLSQNKKNLACMLTHKTSSQLNPNLYNSVFESPNKKGGINEEDIVVFDKSRGWCSVVSIEFCNTDEIADMFIIARDLMETYSFLDFFLCDEKRGVWYNIKKGCLGYEFSTNTLSHEIFPDKSID